MKNRKNVIIFIVTIFIVSLTLVSIIDVYEMRMFSKQIEYNPCIWFALLSKIVIVILLFIISLYFVIKLFDKEVSFDYMTGLYSRRRLFHDLNILINKKAEFALCYIDFNDFKYVNDQYGHEAGDMLLKTFAKRILNLKRKKIAGYRIGGDEFVVIIKKFIQMEDSIQSIWDVTRDDVNVTPTHVEKIKFAMGIAKNDFASTAEQLIKKADHSMYLTKMSSIHTNRGYV